MDTVYIVGIVVVGILAVYFGVAHFIEQGKLNRKVVETIEDKTDEAIGIARDFLLVIDLGKAEKTINTILNATEDIVHYVVNSINPNTDKKQVTVDVVNAILGELKIDISGDQQKLIGLVVDNSIRRIEKKQK